MLLTRRCRYKSPHLHKHATCRFTEYGTVPSIMEEDLLAEQVHRISLKNAIETTRIQASIGPAWNCFTEIAGSASPSCAYRTYWRWREHHLQICIARSRDRGQYVARGLVLAAADRANAPPQKALANYAVLEDIPYDENEDELSQNGSKKWKNKDTGDMEARGIPHWIIRENYRFTDVRSDYTFWAFKNAWPLEATVVAKTGEAPELYQITHEKNKGKLLILHMVVTELDLIDYLDHRVVARVQFEDTLRPRRVKGQQRKCQQYTVQTIIRQHIRGPDLVLTWVWLGNWEDGPEGQPGSYSGGEIQLAEQVVNMAASFDIEDVEIQFADAPEESGDQMLDMPGPSSARSSTIARRAVFEQPTTDRSRERGSSKMKSNEPRDSSPRVSRRRRPESQTGHPSC
ncbi:hypothetical protein FB567DRAFT_575723 [Paraphoma chrysanthemicola]|uniref:Uncharacterized protein n=1 Tax=Paraphoma chrysanthemicola TaxID=798071 RepID=A0A8K0W2Z5_9PLEO|nr:hypothetical protein FB567DRAFT_575723 [Paraphoma chrysanthemicola]